MLSEYTRLTVLLRLFQTVMTKSFLQLVIVVAAFFGGGWLSYRFFAAEHKPKEEATVLLEKIQAVSKLITVEGQFSEIYSYKSPDNYMILFHKSALVRVQAKVSAGYDLNNLHVVADPAKLTIRMNALPEPQILSIDHVLDYYDISEGMFSPLTPEDYNQINQHAKDIIRDKALQSNLLPAAREQAGKMIDLIRFMVQSSGWKFEVDGGLPAKTHG
jgi:hypothetical protein